MGNPERIKESQDINKNEKHHSWLAWLSNAQQPAARKDRARDKYCQLRDEFFHLSARLNRRNLICLLGSYAMPGNLRIKRALREKARLPKHIATIISSSCLMPADTATNMSQTAYCYHSDSRGSVSHREGWEIERLQLLSLWKVQSEIPSDRSQLAAESIEPFISQICIHYRKSQRRELLYTAYIFSSPGFVAIGLNVRGREEKKFNFGLPCGFLRSSRFARLVCSFLDILGWIPLHEERAIGFRNQIQPLFHWFFK